MKELYLEDLLGLTQEEVKEHISCSYEVDINEVNKYEILIAYESVGNWGCDSSSWFLLREIDSGELFEIHGGDCSCFGFEGQFEPEETTLEYLQSDKFYFNCGGYDDNDQENEAKVKEYLKNMSHGEA